MEAMIGFVIGYIAGSKAGEKGYRELKEAWEAILASPEFQGLVSTGVQTARSLIGARGRRGTDLDRVVGSAVSAALGFLEQRRRGLRVVGG